MFSSMDTLASVVEAESWALLTTVDRDGGLHTRPVRCLRVPFRGQIWLDAEGDPAAGEDVGEGTEVSVAFGDATQGPYASVSGWAVCLRGRGLHRDRTDRSIPSRSATAQRPLLCVTARAAQLWEGAASTAGKASRVFAFPAFHARPADEATPIARASLEQSI